MKQRQRLRRAHAGRGTCFWRPISSAPATGYMLVRGAGAVRAQWRFKGKWHPAGYPALKPVALNPWDAHTLRDCYEVGPHAERMLSRIGHTMVILDAIIENPAEWMPIP